MNGGEYIDAVVYGNKLTAEALLTMDKRVDVATASALRQVQLLTKRSVRAQLKGKPRWGFRGASKKTGESVNLGFRHAPRGGPPGRFKGRLYYNVAASRKPRVKFGAMSGVVFVGTGSMENGNVQNIYKHGLEAKYPYFRPGVKNAEPKMPAVWDKAWAKATKV
jgi:hypothetical protein